MSPIVIRWKTPPLSTSSLTAARQYREGIAALVSSRAHADRLLAAAVTADPSFVLARVGLAVSRTLAGGPYLPPDVPFGSVERGERQHAEIVGAWLRGEARRAADLRREHLLEFPGDVLVVWLPALPAASSDIADASIDRR
jgi:hypothetical protein